MPLINNIDVPFSRLRENHEEATVRFGKNGDTENSLFTCYGYLPNGDRYGVAEIGVWFDPGYYEHDAIVVGPDGENKDKILLKDHYFSGFPDAMTASPTGRRIIWKIGGEVFCWDSTAMQSPVVRINDYLPEKTEISDAVMRENGLLDLICSDSISRRYLCDTDALLVLKSGSLTAYCGEDSCSLFNQILQDVLCEDSTVNSIVLRDDVERVEPTAFSDCGLHELRLSQSLQYIGYGAFENNPALGKIFVPAGVTDVESHAFGGCTGLRDLVIEGDPVRARLWAVDAFSGCPCEEAYQQIRASALKTNQ